MPLACAFALAIAGCGSAADTPVEARPLAVFALTPPSAFLAPGEQIRMTALIPDSLAGIASSFTWSTDAPSVATVSSNGMVRGVTPGRVRISFGGERAAGYAIITVGIPDPSP
jgi:uncharacterized protein YjdB